MPKLTKRTVDAARPTASDYFVFDNDLPGFGLRVMPSGQKSYMIQYRANRRTRRITFGRHGPMTPTQARRKAMQLLAAINDGEDPAEQLRGRRSAPTVGQVCERFMTEHVVQHCKATTAYEYRRSVELFIKPAFGNHNIRDITRGDVAQLHHDMRDIPYQANRTLGVLSKLFNLAEVWGLRPDGSNPCRHVKRYKERRRSRFLSPDEMARLGTVLRQIETEGSETPSAVAAIRLLALTGCRLSEILTLKWAYITDAIHLPDSKTGEKAVYIGEPVRQALDGIKRLSDNPYVIVGKNPGTHLTDLQRPWRRIRKRAGLDDVRIHDLRHSFASSAVTAGEGLPMIGKLLGHAQVQTTARYAHLAADPVQAAAERVSAELARSLNGGTAA